MNSFSYLRVCFFLISTVYGAIIFSTLDSSHFNLYNTIVGATSGALFSGLIFLFEKSFFSKISLRTLNLLSLGTLFGLFFATSLYSLFSSLLLAGSIYLSPPVHQLVGALIYLTSIYYGILITCSASQEFYLSIPFVRLFPTTTTKRDLLLDHSALQDPRLIDLATSGILDQQIMIPRYIIHDLRQTSEHADEEHTRLKAKRALEVITRLEAMPELNIRYTEQDFPELKDPIARFIRLAKHLDCNILTSDISRVQQSSFEDIRIVNINSLSNALKPLAQNGEFLSIYVRRYGKEARQGVGYLEDGTMVVVNGGADYIDKTIRVQVLSVKHTPSGRMIFCNTTEESESELQMQSIGQEMPKEMDLKRYFTV